MTEQELLDLKDDLAEAKTKVAELTGQQTALMNQLKNDYGCDTIQEAETKAKEIKARITSLDEKITQQSTELEALLDSN